MKPRVTVGHTRTPDGEVIELVLHDGDYRLMVGRSMLMTSRMHHAEEQLATLACDGLASGAQLLVGGLGFGYTLRAALDLLPADGRATVAELIPEIVAWNRGPLARLASAPLDDPRVAVHIGDVMDVVRCHDATFAAILLDVDNGPTPLVARRNAAVYSDRGLRALRSALAPGGRLAIWSADVAHGLAERLSRQGLTPTTHSVRSRPGRGGHHQVVIGYRPLRS